MQEKAGMTARQAKAIEWSIIGLCLVALFCVFQPIAISLFSVGAVLVVVAGLAFNLVPFCRAGVPLSALGRVAVIVVVTLLVVAGLAIGSAYLYGKYFVGG